MIMIKAKIKKSFLVISPPPFGGKHSTVKIFPAHIIQYNYSLHKRTFMKMTN